jgi:hypothetical protein
MLTTEASIADINEKECSGCWRRRRFLMPSVLLDSRGYEHNVAAEAHL